MKKISFIILPVLFLLYLLVETYLKFHNSSLCATSGCNLAGGLLTIKPIYLNYLGLLSAFGLVASGFLSYKSVVSQKVFFFILYLSIFFETVMIGFQYFASPQICLICVIVYGFLIVMAILGDYKRFFLILPFILVSLVALSFLAIHAKRSFVQDDGLYLIYSDKCKHCIKVKKYFKEHNISYNKISIANIEARNFLRFMDKNIIPDLIIKDGIKYTIISGDENIIKYFENRMNLSNKVAHEEKDKTIKDIDIHLINEDGCGISIFQSKDLNCDK